MFAQPGLRPLHSMHMLAATEHLSRRGRRLVRVQSGLQRRLLGRRWLLEGRDVRRLRIVALRCWADVAAGLQHLPARLRARGAQPIVAPVEDAISKELGMQVGIIFAPACRPCHNAGCSHIESDLLCVQAHVCLWGGCVLECRQVATTGHSWAHTGGFARASHLQRTEATMSISINSSRGMPRLLFEALSALANPTAMWHNVDTTQMMCVGTGSTAAYPQGSL